MIHQSFLKRTSTKVITGLFFLGLLTSESGFSAVRVDAWRPPHRQPKLFKLDKKKGELKFELEKLEASLAAQQKEGKMGDLSHSISERRQTLKEIEAEIKRLETEDRPRLEKEFTDNLEDGKKGPWLQDYIRYTKVRRLPKESTVAFVVETEPGTSEARRLIGIAQTLAERGYQVLYSADSEFGRVLGGFLGKQGLGISAIRPTTPYGSTPIIQIQNPYLRFMAFGGAREVIINSKSTLGAALAINGQATVAFGSRQDIESKIQFSQVGQLHDFRASLDRSKKNMGVKYLQLRQHWKSNELLNERNAIGELIFPSLKVAGSQKGLLGEPSDFVKKMSSSEIDLALNYGTIMSEQSDKLTKTGGAVVFGSAKLIPGQNNLTYEIGKIHAQNGIPTTSGGAGGQMLTSLKGAFDAGGQAIGIPIGGRSQLAAESRVPTEVHTDTVMTTDYDSRISLLLAGKKIVELVPGGSGTMKELAVTLSFMEEALLRGEPLPAVVLINNSYYAPLKSWLDSLLIRPEIKKRIFVINEAKELQEIIDQTPSAKTDSPGVPRNETTSFD